MGRRGGDIRYHVRFIVANDRGTGSELKISRLEQAVYYTVRFDTHGCCKFYNGSEPFNPWQVLKLAIEPILFQTRSWS